MTLDTTGLVKAPADLFRAIDAFEAAVQPAYGANFTAFSQVAADPMGCRQPARGETLSPEEIDEARLRKSAEDRGGHSASNRTRRRSKRGSCWSSRACTACRTTRFRTPT